MNWAKKLLQKDDESFTLPSHDCPRCGGRLIDEGDTVHCDTCNYPEPEDGFDEEGNPIEVDEPACDVCGEVLGAEYPTCPVCGVALCGDKECADEHIAKHHHEWNDEDEDEDTPLCDYCGRDIDPDANWTLETRDGTEHFCCAECQHERAAEIEATPLCTWCHEKCDQGVIHAGLNPKPFCSTECLEKFRVFVSGITVDKNEPSGRCDDCERDGGCDGCPGHPGYTKPNPF